MVLILQVITARNITLYKLTAGGWHEYTVPNAFVKGVSISDLLRQHLVLNPSFHISKFELQKSVRLHFFSIL